MGWRVAEDGAGGFVLTAPGLCDESEDSISVEAGDLRSFLRSPPNRCRYQRLLAPAAERAASRLAANSKYRFSGIFRFMRLPRAWRGEGERSGLLRGRTSARPRDRDAPSDAIESLYESRARAECAVGRQVMELATQYELYGEADFDRAFSGPDDLRVGAWHSLMSRGGNAAYALNSGFRPVDEREAVFAGPYAWSGLSLYIGNVYGERFLDTPNDRGENAVVVRVSSEAQEAFRRASSLPSARITGIALRMWETASRFRNSLRANYEGFILKLMRDGFEGDEALERELIRLPWNAENAAHARELYRLSRLPEVRGFEVFVHPLGRKTVAYHLLRLLILNPRTPYDFAFEDARIRDGLFERFVDFRLNECRKEVQ